MACDVVTSCHDNIVNVVMMSQWMLKWVGTLDTDNSSVASCCYGSHSNYSNLWNDRKIIKLLSGLSILIDLNLQLVNM